MLTATESRRPLHSPVAFLSSVFIRLGIKITGAEKILTQYVKGIFIDANVLFRQVFAKEIPHDPASEPASLRYDALPVTIRAA